MENSGNVDFAIHSHQRDGGGRAGAEAFEFAHPMLQGDVSSLRWRKMRQARAAAPVLIDIGYQGIEGLVGRQPMAEPRKRSIEYERVAPAGMSGREKRSQRPPFR